MHLRCPHCHNPIELANVPSVGEITCAGCGSSFRLDKFSTATFDAATTNRIGKFEILATVGHGAFGTVLKAKDPELDRIVAIKVPRASNVGTNQAQVDRFLREARAVAQLRFPSIISVYEVGMSNGAPYLVSDFVAGITLADHLTGRGFSFTESAKLIAEVADALQYAHTLGVVHRDVKPSNIMIRPDGSPCVMDFGLAKRDAGEITMTIDGQILGTPAYMSPEQARGDAHKVDGRSDVYSLGVILYQLLTNELPFRGNKAMLLHQVLHEEPTSPRSLNDKIPRDLETIALKAMAKEPGRRYTSAKELAEDLRRWLAGEPILARPIGGIERAWRWAKRKPALATANAAVVALLVTFVAAFLIVSASLRNVQQQTRERVLAQVNALRDATAGAVPAILAELRANREIILPQLRERFALENDPSKRMRLALALVDVEPAALRDELAAWMLQVEDPAEVLLVRATLEPHKLEIIDRMWQATESPEQRLRAAAALALYDADNARWMQARDKVVDDFVAVNPVYLGAWSEAFRPVKEKLLLPLSGIYRDRQPERSAERTLATSLLADYAAEQPAVLADLLMDADEKQFTVIYAKFKEQSERGVPVLTGEIDKTLRSELPSSDPSREKLAQRQANAAVALLKMNQSAKVWPLLKHSPDPRARSYLIHRLYPLGVDAAAIVERLDKESDVSIRRALLLSLGEYGEKPSAEARKEVLAKVQGIYRTESDPGLHASSEWLLRTWNQEAWLKQINEEWTKASVEGLAQRGINEPRRENVGLKLGRSPSWYVNGQGQTMVVIPGPVEFLMGSPPTEAGRQDDEVQHKRRISRTFAIAAKSVTVEQYRKFDRGYQLMAKYTRTADLPLVGLSWYEAAAYCNWLSKEEGIAPDQWCYEIKGQVTKLKENYLSLTGYRLPTETELEYATRAGALTSRYYGETEELLAKYAWYVKNSREQTWPVGRLMPNDLGLFDAHGNAYTWCQERYKRVPSGKGDATVEDKEDNTVVSFTQSRVLRGGSFTSQASSVRSSYRPNFVPASTNAFNGLRPSRTLPLGSTTTPFTP